MRLTKTILDALEKLIIIIINIISFIILVSADFKITFSLPSYFIFIRNVQGKRGCSAGSGLFEGYEKDRGAGKGNQESQRMGILFGSSSEGGSIEGKRGRCKKSAEKKRA